MRQSAVTSHRYQSPGQTLGSDSCPQCKGDYILHGSRKVCGTCGLPEPSPAVPVPPARPSAPAVSDPPSRPRGRPRKNPVPVAVDAVEASDLADRIDRIDREGSLPSPVEE